MCARPTADRAPASAAGSKLNGRPRPDALGREVARVVGLQRVAGQHPLAHGAAARAVEGVEQLAQRHGGRAGGAGVLVGAGVGDDQRARWRRMIASSSSWRSSDCGVALAGERVAGEHVVAVDRLGAGEDAVVEADEAHDPVGHRAHRHHRADGEGAGAEVGARGPAGRVARRAAPGRRPAAVGVEPAPGATACTSAQLPVELRRLPHVGSGTPGRAPRTPSPSAPSQSGTVAAASRRCRQRLEAVDELGQPAGQLDVGCCRRRRAAAPRRGAGARRRTSPRRSAPGRGRPARCSGGTRSSRKRRALPAVETPPDAGLAHPPAIRVRSSSVKPEPAAHRRGAARSSTSLARARPAARLTSAAATASSGLVLLSARSASRTRSR